MPKRLFPPKGIAACRAGLTGDGRCAVCREFIAKRGRMRLDFAADHGKRDYWLVWPRGGSVPALKRIQALICRTYVKFGQTVRHRVGLLPTEIAGELPAAFERRNEAEITMLSRVVSVAELCLERGMDYAPASICEVRRWLDTHGSDWLALRADPEWAKANERIDR